MNNLGFTISYSDLSNWVFIPKYYNPQVKETLNGLSSTHDLVEIKELVEADFITLESGNEIGKMAYGTGKIPFIRTSDISNWEIKSDPKQGVSEKIYDEYASRQDVQEGDIFFVKDGTYLIGQSAIVTKYDLPCLFQSHVLKIRINKNCPWDSYLFFALLNTPIVKQQIRSKQFTADIIDTIGSRFLELILPIPKDKIELLNIINKTKAIINNRNLFRERIKKLPLLAQGLIGDLNEDYNFPQVRIEDSIHILGYTIKFSDVANNTFIPKYYNPLLQQELIALKDTHDLVSLQQFVDEGLLTWDTGIEVGKLAYGTGDIPFIRTSDISNLELKNDPKQNVSEEIYVKNKQDVMEGDIFVVRDGTYLVGISCIITKGDTKILYCGGIYRLRVVKKEAIDPYLLLAILNTPVVKKQMKSKQFTRDIIDTLGKRIFEILLPIPKDKKLKDFISTNMKEAIENRVTSRQAAIDILTTIN